MRRAFLALAIFGAIATLIAMLQDKRPIQPAATLEIPNNIDYYLKNTHQVSFKDDGSIDFTLDSSLIEHFKHEDKSVMQQPDVVMMGADAWHVTAKKGHFFHPEEIMTFNTDVILIKKDAVDPFNVYGKELQFNIQQDLVISKTNVKVEGDNWYLNAQTMTLDMDKEIHQFTTVNAQYRNDKKS